MDTEAKYLHHVPNLKKMHPKATFIRPTTTMKPYASRITTPNNTRTSPAKPGVVFHVLMMSVFACHCKGVCGDNHGPVFSQEPPSFVDFSNSTGARVECSAHGTPTPQTRWVHADGTKVVDVRDVRLTFTNGSMVFQPFPAEGYRQDVHAAIYRCIATNTVGEVTSRDVRVRAVVMQMYDVQVYNEFVIRGNTAVLKCHIPSYVTDYIKVTSWIRDSAFNIHSQIETGGHYMIMPSGELHIRDVGPNDAYRSYRCRTMHKLTGETRISSTAGRLLISDPQGSVSPRITDTKASTQVTQGETAILPCASQGHPVPSYSWYTKTNRSQMIPLPLSNRIQQVGGTLVISNTVISDGMTYVCVVSNSVGNQTAVTVLSVTVPLSVYVQPHKQKVDLGKPAMFSCKVVGYPIGSITWLKDTRAAAVPSQLSSPEILRIDSVQRGQNGMYQCFVRNDFESAQGITELRLGDSAPELHGTFQERVLHPGSSISLQCIASANPSAEILWTLDDSQIANERRFRFSQFVNSHGDTVGHLNITSLHTEDGGEFTCIAKNHLGKASHTARINVLGPPGIREMSKMSVVAGEEAFVKCKVYGHPIDAISWEKDGVSLPINRRQKVFPNGTLLIQHVQKNADGGRYSCVVRNEGKDVIRKEVQIIVMVPPKITPFSFQDEDLYEGMRAQVTCAVRQGDMPITIQWLKDGHPVQPGQGVILRVFDVFTSSLSIESASSQHNGNYTCVASNLAASVTYSTSLRVNVPPRWIVEPKDTQVVVQGTLIINCQAGGYPAPIITWMKAVGDVPADYKEIVTNDPNVLVLQNGSLLLNSATENDQGYYLCQATNNIGEGLSKVFFLDVHVPVTFTMKYTNHTVKRGNNVRLRCDASGDLPVRISWSFGGQVIDPVVRPRYRIKETDVRHGRTSELILTKSERSDSGIYSCSGSNVYGQDIAEFQLTIQEPPEPPRSVSVLEHDARSVQLTWTLPYNGNSAIVKSIVQYKEALASWQDGCTNITIANSATMTVVSNLIPATKYTFRVIAENNVGESVPSETVTITTSEEAPSAPPIEVQVEATQSRILKVSWKAPLKAMWNGEILGYNVGYRLHDSGEPFLFKAMESVGDAGGQMELKDLRSFSKYDIVVQAYNRIGPGPLCTAIVATTAEEVPSKSPSDVQCKSHSSQSIHVTWSPPALESINGILQGYKVLYIPLSDNYKLHDGTEKDTKITPSLDTILHGLEKYRNYSVQVLAFTRVGDGVKSPAVFCSTLQDVPEAPSDIKAILTSADTLLLCWLPPKEPNGIIVRYTVYIRSAETGKENTTKFVLSGKQLSYTTKGLKKGRRYEFWVTSSTVIGEGQSTKMVNLIPSSKIPGKITSFGKKIVIPWKGDVEMVCEMVGNPTPQRRWNIDGHSLTESDRIRITVNGSLLIRSILLMDSGNYSCHVENVHGSDTVYYRVLVQAPPVSPDVAIASTTASSVTVHWKTGSDGGSPILGYSLSFKRDYGEWEEVQIDREQRMHTLENLWCGSKYQLYMSAFNIIGSAEPSEVITTKTKGEVPSAPLRDNVIHPDSNFVAMDLNSWDDGGCTILYFVIEYKPKGTSEWILVSNSVKQQNELFIIPDLEPGKEYSIRITAHSSAGSVVSEYDFTTFSSSGRSALPAEESQTEDYIPFYYDLKLIIPVIVAMLGVVIIVGIYALCIGYRHEKLRNKRTQANYASENQKGGDIELVHEFNTKSAGPRPDFDKKDFNYLISPPERPHFNYLHAGMEDDVCPYATYKIPDSSNKIEVHAPGWQELPLKTSSLRNYDSIAKNDNKQLFPLQKQAAPETTVPDLLYRGNESTTSNDSSPEAEWKRYNVEVADRIFTSGQRNIIPSRIPYSVKYRESGLKVDENRLQYSTEPSAPSLQDHYCDRDDVETSKRMINLPLHHRLSSTGEVV